MCVFEHDYNQGGMMKKVSVLLFLVFAASTLGAVEVTPGGSLLFWNFWYNNADFNNDTEDGDNWYFLFGNVTVEAKWDEHLTFFVNPSALGVSGMHPCLNCGAMSPSVTLHQMYMDLNNIFDTPLSLRAGKWRMMYDDAFVVWDGGAEGVTGAKANICTDMLDLDILAIRVAEYGGPGFISAGPQPDTLEVQVPPDQNLYGAHATLKFLEDMLEVNGYFYDLMWGDDSPMWFGGRFAGDISGLEPKAEFVMMMGDNGADPAIDYKGMAYTGQLTYGLPMAPVKIGGGYVYFSGDDPTTDTENEAYSNVLQSVYMYQGAAATGFLGFGPAHLILTGGFCPNPNNMSVINGNLQFNPGDLTVRADFFMYKMNEVPDGVDDAMGNEVSVVLKYNYRDLITLGASAGYFMPGDYYGADLDPMMGGIFFFNKSF
jgi:hypothetical protein